MVVNRGAFFRRALVGGALGLAALSGCAGHGAKWVTVATDEGSVEEQLATYLEQTAGLHVTVANGADPSDRFVVMQMEGTGGAPDFDMVVDTLPSAQDQNQVTTGRVILVRLKSRVAVPATARVAVLEAINAHHVEYYAGTFWIGTEGEVDGQWPLNITADEAPVHAAMVADAILRLWQSWDALYPAVGQAIAQSNGPAPTQQPPAREGATPQNGGEITRAGE